jgi:hypothetical protein
MSGPWLVVRDDRGECQLLEYDILDLTSFYDGGRVRIERNQREYASAETGLHYFRYRDSEGVMENEVPIFTTQLVWMRNHMELFLALMRSGSRAIQKAPATSDLVVVVVVEKSPKPVKEGGTETREIPEAFASPPPPQESVLTSLRLGDLYCWVRKSDGESLLWLSYYPDTSEKGTLFVSGSFC